tara:strand:- start:195 stop:881 length:687 start_codon:yes stop_codon:yes gene_type:complete
MAKDKKGFILYADLIKVVSKLPDETAGRLFKIILSYVNDLDVNIDDLLLEIAFEPIKNQLKRDLIKFEEVKSKRSDAGKRSAELRALKREEQSPTNSTSVESVQQSSTNPTVIDTVNDTVNDTVTDKDTNKQKEKVPVFNFRKELLNLGGDEQLVSDWMLVRKKLKATNTKTSLNRFLKQVELSGKDLNFALGYVAGNGWKGFEAKWLGQTNSFSVNKPRINTKGVDL